MGKFTDWHGKPVDIEQKPIDGRLDALIRKGDVYLMARDRKETEKRAHQLYRKGCRDLALAAMEGAKQQAETASKGGRPEATVTAEAATYYLSRRAAGDTRTIKAILDAGKFKVSAAAVSAWLRRKRRA
jgi:hypothetical protein